MRPLKLKFKNLRSYRSEQVVDFTGRDLVAVIGATGAGKSSLLEAICFALYGRCTWEGQSAKDLIADGTDGTLTVELTFRVQDTTWRVTRTTSLRNSPPSTHRLESLDDGTVFDGAGPVKAKIRSLVGFDRETFLKAVLLPQGKFQELLHTGRSDRTTVFKSILGLDRIDEVRTEAAAAVHRLAPKVEGLKGRRSGLPADIDRDIRDAERRLHRAQQEGARLEKVEAEIAGLRDVKEGASRQAHDLRINARHLHEVPERIPERFAELVDRDTELSGRLELARKQVDAARADEEAVEQVLAAADDAGTGLAAATKALTTFDSVVSQLPAIAEERLRLVETNTAINAQAAALDTKESGYGALLDGALAAEKALEQADVHRVEAQRKLESGATLLAAVRKAELKVTSSAAAVTPAELACAEQAKLLESSVDKEIEARKVLEAAEAALETARRAEAAAHAAAESQPGDPCPVCARTLPEDFHRPVSAGITEAQAVRRSAQTRYSKAQKAIPDVAAAHGAAEESLRTARQNAAEAVAAHEEVFQLFEAEFGHRDAGADDETILAAPAEALRTAEGECEILKRTAQIEREKVTKNATELDLGRKELTKHRKELAKAEYALEKRCTALVQANDELSPHFRVQGELTETAVQERRDHAHLRKEELVGASTRLAAIRAGLREARAEHEKLTKRHRDEVERPLSRLRQEILLLAERTADIAELMTLSAAPALATDATIVEESCWAQEVLATAEALANASKSRLDELAARTARANEQITAALTVAAVADETNLAEQLVETKVQKRSAEGDLEVARRRKPLCDELDRRIAQAEPVLAGLRDLCGLLTDGRFIHEVVRRRQLALLGKATRALRSMTGGRFGFHEDFLIIDGLTSQSRDVKTLSGGETFLASLALSLALVELTAEGGARVEALFLDEGFGSLDANTLTSALDKLNELSKMGRLVTVISHMRAVAVNFDNVLSVKSGFTGSSADWLTEEEHAALATEHLSGLLS